jgi:hypothetical protein
MDDVEKALGEQWWNGEAVWRAVMGAPLASPIDCTFLDTVPWLSKGMCSSAKALVTMVQFLFRHLGRTTCDGM